MNEECRIRGCKNKLGWFEKTFGFEYCEECSKLLLSVRSKKGGGSIPEDKAALAKFLDDVEKT